MEHGKDLDNCKRHVDDDSADVDVAMGKVVIFKEGMVVGVICIEFISAEN